MPSYILTGAPGAGKTAILRMLETCGYPVVEEAATDVIALGNALGSASTVARADFIDKVITLQRQRQDSLRAAGGPTVFFDRSPVCTLARNQGFVAATAARQISFEDSLAFERLHEQTYRDLGCISWSRWVRAR